MSSVLADIIAAGHIGYFLFVIGGLMGIVNGLKSRSHLIRNPWFRLSHLAAVWFVVFEDVFKFECPLNTAEWTLRSGSRSVKPIEASSGVGNVLDFLLRHTIPGSFLHVFYWTSAVFLLVILFWVPPRFQVK